MSPDGCMMPSSLKPSQFVFALSTVAYIRFASQAFCKNIAQTASLRTKPLAVYVTQKAADQFPRTILRKILCILIANYAYHLYQKFCKHFGGLKRQDLRTEKTSYDGDTVGSHPR
jgi:hypothetical protein